MRNHSFGVPFNFKRLASLVEIAETWDGIDFEFEDKDLDGFSFDLIRLTRELVEKISLYAGPADNWPEGTLSVPTDEERSADLFSERTAENIRELDSLASELLKRYEAFERCLRKKIPALSASPEN